VTTAILDSGCLFSWCPDLPVPLWPMSSWVGVLLALLSSDFWEHLLVTQSLDSVPALSQLLPAVQVLRPASASFFCYLCRLCAAGGSPASLQGHRGSDMAPPSSFSLWYLGPPMSPCLTSSLLKQTFLAHSSRRAAQVGGHGCWDVFLADSVMLGPKCHGTLCGQLLEALLLWSSGVLSHQSGAFWTTGR
jgi:hypothetical protein